MNTTLAGPHDVTDAVARERYWTILRSPYDEPWLTKEVLGDHFGMSKRWVEDRIREGMPARKVGTKEVRLRVSECEPWLIEHGHFERIGDNRG